MSGGHLPLASRYYESLEADKLHSVVLSGRQGSITMQLHPPPPNPYDVKALAGVDSFYRWT